MRVTVGLVSFHSKRTLSKTTSQDCKDSISQHFPSITRAVDRTCTQDFITCYMNLRNLCKAMICTVSFIFHFLKVLCSVYSQFCDFFITGIEKQMVIKYSRSTRKMFVLLQGKTTLPSIQSALVYLLFSPCSPPQTPIIRDYISDSRMFAPASLVWHTFCHWK